MQQKKIAKEQWHRFCEEFNRAHHGWLVTLLATESARMDIEPDEAEQDARHLTPMVPLHGVLLEAAQDGMHVGVEVGPEEHRMTHVLPGPVAGLFSLSEDEEHLGLRIDDVKGGSTLVRFRSAASPEALDGIAPSEM